MEIVSRSEEETKDFALRFASGLSPAKTGALVIGLYGNLGAGKTTFMKFFALALGVKETIQSPTFVIMKFFRIPDHQYFKKLIHIDAYRLDSPDDLLKLGWAEIVANKENVVCVEWPERVASIMGEHFVLKFEHGEGEQERKISTA